MSASLIVFLFLVTLVIVLLIIASDRWKSLASLGSNISIPGKKTWGWVAGILVLSIVVWASLQSSKSKSDNLQDKENQQTTQTKWVGETVVGKEWTEIRTPPNRADFTYYVVEPKQDTNVTFQLHGGTGHYILADGTHTKKVTKINGLPAEKLTRSGWEGEINGITAKSNNGKIVVVKCVEN